MKRTHLLLPFLGSALLALMPGLSAKPLAAEIKTKDGSFNCYLVTYDQNGIGYSRLAAGNNPAQLAHSAIESIQLDPPETWGESNLAWNEKDYQTAAASFGKIADEYANLGLFANEYPAKARYYQLQSLKKIGDYANLDKVVRQVQTKTPIALDGFLKDELALLGGWSLLGRQDWDGLIAFVDQYQTKLGDHPRPAFKKGTSRGRIAELSYLRGVARLAKKEESAGLEDLQRALVVDFGSNTEVSRAAAEAILEVLSRKTDDASKREAYGTAIFLRDAVNGGRIDSKYGPLLERPKGLDVKVEKPKEEAKPAAAAPAPAAPAKK